MSEPRKAFLLDRMGAHRQGSTTLGGCIRNCNALAGDALAAFITGQTGAAATIGYVGFLAF